MLDSRQIATMGGQGARSSEVAAIADALSCIPRSDLDGLQGSRPSPWCCSTYDHPSHSASALRLAIAYPPRLRVRSCASSRWLESRQV